MSESEQTEPKGLDLPRLFALTLAHKGWIVLPTLAAFAAALLFVALVKPHYMATVKVLLEDGESYYTRPEKATPGVVGIIDEFEVASEAEAAKSPDVERKALEKLTPEDREEFSSGGMFSRLLGQGEDSETRRIESFGRAVEVFPQAKTRVLLFEFTSLDRARARRGAEAMAQAFLESQQVAKDEEAKSASRWLSQQIDALRAKVAAEEAKVEALRGESGLLTGVNGVAVPSQQLGEIAGQIATARAAQAGASAKAAALKGLVRAGRLDEIPAIANDESLRRYSESRVAVKAQIAENLRTLLPGHPRMKELAGELAGFEQQIREAAMKRVHGLEEEARIAADQVASLQGAVNDQAKTVSSSDADQAKLRELEIDAKTGRDQLESYLTKYREAMARDVASDSPADGRIIAHALTPTSASFPKVGPTLLLTPMAAFFICLGLVVAKILLTDGAAPASTPARVRAERVEPKWPFGVDPPQAVERAPEARASIADPAIFAPTPDADGLWTTQIEAYVERLADASAGASLPVLVAGAGTTGALPAALAAARKLSLRGATALVDLGASPAWLSDLFDVSRDPRRAATLAQLAQDPSLLPETAERDLSSPLDIFPGGPGAGVDDDLRGLWQGLSSAYAYVVVHAPDWRDPACIDAVEDMAALLIVAPTQELEIVVARVRRAFQDEGVAIKGFAYGAAPQAQAA